jgi:hypothetical protein
VVNHFRTLLLNVSGAEVPLGAYPGDEYVDPAFGNVALPTYLTTVRQFLFGASPDRYMLNYRVRQYLSLVHATPLAEYVTALDPRLTYDLRDNALLDDGLYAPEVFKLTGVDTDRLSVVGTPAPPDASGRMFHAFDLVTLDDHEVRVSRTNPPLSNVVLEFGDQTPVELHGSGYKAVLYSNSDLQSWHVEVLNRPQWDVGQVAANLLLLGEPVADQLFGITKDEPYYSFRNIWLRSLELPLRLAAVLTALAYRTEEVRNG